jgi:hypothetical protein
MLLTTTCAQSAHATSSPEKNEKNGRTSLPLLQASHHVTNTDGTTTRGVVGFLLLAIVYVLFLLGTAAVVWLGLKLIESCLLFLFPFDLGIISPPSSIQGWRGIIGVAIVGTAFFILFVGAMPLLFEDGLRAQKDNKHPQSRR